MAAVEAQRKGRRERERTVFPLAPPTVCNPPPTNASPLATNTVHIARPGSRRRSAHPPHTIWILLGSLGRIHQDERLSDARAGSDHNRRPVARTCSPTKTPHPPPKRASHQGRKRSCSRVD
jgi:hypothetical protein